MEEFQPGPQVVEDSVLKLNLLKDSCSNQVLLEAEGMPPGNPRRYYIDMLGGIELILDEVIESLRVEDQRGN